MQRPTYYARPHLRGGGDPDIGHPSHRLGSDRVSDVDRSQLPQAHKIISLRRRTEKAGAKCSGLSNCAATCGVTGVLAATARWLRQGERDYRAACINLKFTTGRAAADLEDGKMVNRGSDPRSSLVPEPLRPFTCPIGEEDRSGNFRPKRL